MEDHGELLACGTMMSINSIVEVIWSQYSLSEITYKVRLAFLT